MKGKSKNWKFAADKLLAVNLAKEFAMLELLHDAKHLINCNVG